MHTLKQVNSDMPACGRISFRPLTALKPVATTLLFLMAGLAVSSAANITLKTSDAAGTSSFTGSTNWSNGAVPSAGNTYSIGALTIRSVNNSTTGATNIFGGDSLSIDAGGRFLAKVGNNVVGNTTVATNIANYILNGGVMDQAGVNTDSSTCVIGGTVLVNASSVLGALGGTGNGSASFETLNIIAPISGSAALQVSGANANAGADTGVVALGASNLYSGVITVTNASAGVIASTVNRLLQLNNVNALGNATLNLMTTAANPVSFTSAANTGVFNLGALSGNSSQTLTDTAGNAVALSVGGNNANTAYNGAMTGSGSLVKVGTGTLTFSGTNTYTGTTTVSSGTLALASSALLANSSITVGAGATFDVSSNAFTLVSGQSLAGNGTVKGAVTVASGAKIYADAGVPYGTNTFTTNVTVLSGGQVNMNLGAAYNGANDLLVIGGNLTLNSPTFVLNAPGTSVNLDQTADYTLVSVAGTITGNPALVWGVAPANSAHYSIVKNGANIVLHYSASLAPAGNGSVSPNPVVRNQPVLITVTVTFNANPITSVTVDASQLGGSSSLALVAAGGGVYTNTVVVAPNLAASTVTLVATMMDSVSAVGTTAPFTLTINTAAETWNGLGSDNSWGTSPNWLGGFAPGYVGDSLTFAGTTRLAPVMNANYTITGLTFDGSAGSFALNGNGNLLTLTGGIANNSANPQTLNLSIANAGNLTDFSGGNNVVVNGGISGTGGLQNDNSAAVVLNGTNAFTGGININSGILQIAGAGLLGGTNGIYNGNITNSGLFQYSSSSTQTLAGVVSWYGNVIQDGSGKLVLAGNNTYFADTYISNGILQVTGTLANDIGNNYIYDITDNGTLEWSSAAVQTLSGVIAGTGGLLMDGSGTLILNGASTYTGTTVVSGGTLIYNPNTVGYSTIAGITVNSGGKVTVNANNSTSLPVGTLNLNSNGVLNLSYNFGGGNPTVAAIGAVNVSGTAGMILISGFGAAIGQFPLISYTGTSLPNLNNLTLILPPGLSGNLVNNTINKSIDLNVTASSPSTWIALTATDAAGTSSFTNSGNWSNGSQPASGNGYYTQGFTLRSPADANSYTFGGSALSIDQYLFGSAGGRFLLKGPGGAVITVTNLILNGGLLDYANGGDTGIERFSGNILLNGGTTSYIGALAGPGYFETFIVNAPITGGGNMQIGGVNVNGGADIGVVEMNAVNTYTGATTVATGTLLVNGSVGNASMTVLTNATLGGVGSIGGAVTVQSGGILAPGISVGGVLTNVFGTLTVGSAVSVSGTMRMAINRTNSPNSDELSAPAIVINSGATFTVNNLGATNLTAGDTFTLFSTPVSGSFSLTNLPALPGSNLAWTNRLAVDGTIAVISVAAGPSGPSVLTNSFNAASGSLNLSWPANQGWRLQAQTNSLSQGLGTNWVYVTDGTVSSTNFNINVSNGSVFYRLTYP